MNLDNSFKVEHNYTVCFTTNYLTAPVIQKIKNSNAKLALVFDQGFKDNWPMIVDELQAVFGKALPVIDLVGGELGKTGLSSLEQLLGAFNDYNLPKGSYVLTFGGGSVLDLVGLACSLFHRGLKIVRFPTTVLAQNDAGIGVKNGINLLNQKNCIGTFAVPEAVVNDFRFINTLSLRDKRSGIAEAVKVALLKDKNYFDWLCANTNALASFNFPEMQYMIQKCAQLHLQHIVEGGDPFEAKQSRPLDFGHWLAHRLEVLSGGEIKHGEAVAQGVYIDAKYSQQMHGLQEVDLFKIKKLILNLGFDLSLYQKFDIKDLILGLNDFMNHLGGDFELSVLNSIGVASTSKSIDVNKYLEILSKDDLSL